MAGDPPRGACCLRSGRCVVTTEETCTRFGGTYQGDETACDGVDCPEPPPPVTGACCVRGFCVTVTERLCTALRGTYQGDDTSCDETDCTSMCPCDWDGDGNLSGNDFFEFIGDFLDGNADFNGDGTTDHADLFEFLNCLFRGEC